MKQIEQNLYRLHEDHYKKEEVKEGVSTLSGPKGSETSSQTSKNGAGSHAP
jgi:hypothetical protein